MLSGCAPAPGDQQQPVTLESLYQDAVSGGYTTEIAALEDRHVSREELDSAVNYFGDCLTSAGLRFEFLATNPVDGWRPIYNVFWPGMSDTEGFELANKCSISTLDLVVNGYELSNEDIMEPTFMADVLACMGERGLSAPDQAKALRDLIPLGEKDPNLEVVLGCVHAVGDPMPSGILVAY